MDTLDALRCVGFFFFCLFFGFFHGFATLSRKVHIYVYVYFFLFKSFLVKIGIVQLV